MVQKEKDLSEVSGEIDHLFAQPVKVSQFCSALGISDSVLIRLANNGTLNVITIDRAIFPEDANRLAEQIKQMIESKTWPGWRSHR